MKKITISIICLLFMFSCTENKIESPIGLDKQIQNKTNTTNSNSRLSETVRPLNEEVCKAASLLDKSFGFADFADAGNQLIKIVEEKTGKSLEINSEAYNRLSPNLKGIVNYLNGTTFEYNATTTPEEYRMMILNDCMNFNRRLSDEEYSRLVEAIDASFVVNSYRFSYNQENPPIITMWSWAGIWNGITSVVRCIGGTIGSAILGSVGGAGIGTITMPFIGTISGSAAGAMGGALVGAAEFC